MAEATEGCCRAPDQNSVGPGRRTTRNLAAWVLSPTDLTFLWEECPRCLYRKVVLGQPRPRAPFPRVFGDIDRAMKGCLVGRRAEELAPGAPAGVIGSPDRWVKSVPISLPDCMRPLVLRGRLDALVACDDGGEEVVDFKTSEPAHPHLSLYGRQLHAYAWCLERPAAGPARPVHGLGLLCFSPARFEASRGAGTLVGSLSWMAVPRDEVAFEGFLTVVVRTLEGSEAPLPEEACRFCKPAAAPDSHA